MAFVAVAAACYYTVVGGEGVVHISLPRRCPFISLVARCRMLPLLECLFMNSGQEIGLRCGTSLGKLTRFAKDFFVKHSSSFLGQSLLLSMSTYRV